MKWFLSNVQSLVLCMGKRSVNRKWQSNSVSFVSSGNLSEFNGSQLLKNLNEHVRKTKDSIGKLLFFSSKESKQIIREFLTLLATCHTVVPENKVHTELPTEVAYQASSPGRK